jgi:hypothetical protein
MRAPLRLLLALTSLSFVGASCGQSMLGIMPGVVNDRHNLSLRRSLLAAGIDHVCDEIRTSSLPFRFRDEDPVAGRFFPVSCTSRKLPTGELYVELSGQGYVWTALSYRLGFEAGGGVTYDTDFQLDGSTMYVYFRPRNTAPAVFASRVIEAQTGILGAMLGSGPQSLPNRYGAQIMAFQLSRGFTVIRDASGGISYGVGVVAPGEHPPEAFLNLDHDKPTIANERVDLHPNQRDFAGPFDVPAGKRLGVMVSVAGAQSVDALLVARPIGEAWLTTYTHQVATTPPPGPPLLDDVVVAGPIYQRALDVPPGQYYLVLDFTTTAGRSAPVVVGSDHAVVSYAVQLL